MSWGVDFQCDDLLWSIKVFFILMLVLSMIFQVLKDIILCGNRVSFALLPIRLHLDQRHLDFCMKFFSSQFNASQGTSLEENLNLSRASSFSSTPSVGSNLTDSPTEPLLPFFQVLLCLVFCPVYNPLV